MAVEAKFKYAPGDIVDVPHLCIDNGLVKFALLGQGGQKAYLVQSVMVGKPFEVEVHEDNLRPPNLPEE